MISKDLKTNITNQHCQNKPHATATNIKNKMKQIKLQHHQAEIRKLQNKLNDDQRHLLELNQAQEASSWLTTLPIPGEGFDLTKQLFWDLIQSKYGWNL